MLGWNRLANFHFVAYCLASFACLLVGIAMEQGGDKGRIPAHDPATRQLEMWP